MKQITWFLLLLSFTVLSKDIYVKGYTKSNGTVVAGHYRTSPDSTINNNFSTKGNVNPYTGENGWITKGQEENTSFRQNGISDSSKNNLIYTPKKIKGDIPWLVWLFYGVIISWCFDKREKRGAVATICLSAATLYMMSYKYSILVMLNSYTLWSAANVLMLLFGIFSLYCKMKYNN